MKMEMFLLVLVSGGHFRDLHIYFAEWCMFHKFREEIKVVSIVTKGGGAVGRVTLWQP
jgi:hypothetical protein